MEMPPGRRTRNAEVVFRRLLDQEFPWRVHAPHLRKVLNVAMDYLASDISTWDYICERIGATNPN
jgi:hypothetical protein